MVGVLAIKAVLSIALNPTFLLDSYGTVMYFLLLLLSTTFALLNATQRTMGNRIFWIFMAGGCGLWTFDQWLNVYYRLGFRADPPDSSVADPALFLHLVPFMVAVAMQPHRHRSDQKPSRASLNLLLLLFFWVFLYAYVLFPYQYLFADAAIYNPRFTALYAMENAALVLALGVLVFREQCPWRSVYLHFFGASALYGVSSTIANIVMDYGRPYHGSIYSFAQTASVCWFVWVPLRARKVPLAEVMPSEPYAGRTGFTSLMAKMAVIAIPLIGVFELFRSHELPGMRTFRLAVVLTSVLFLAMAVFLKEYFAKRDLALESRVSRLQARLSEAALVESEDRYRDLVEHSQDLLCTHDLEGNLLSCNPAPARVLGYEVSEVLKTPMREFIAPEYRERFGQYLNRIRTNAADRGLLCVVTRTGERRIWEYNNTLRTEGVPLPIVRGMAHDITERKRAEKALQLFRMLVDQSNDAIEVHDPETLRFIDVNGRSCLDLGYSREQILGMKVHDIDPNADESMVAKINEELRNSGSVVVESLHRRKDGSTFPVELSIKTVHLDRSYVVTVARDITERKRAERALRRREEDYRMFVAQSSEGIFRQDLDAPIPTDLPEEELVHHILYDSYLAECNDAIAKMYGLRSAQDFIGKRLVDMLDPTDPHNVELTRDYIRSGFRVLERESHEVDIQGNPKIFLNSMIGIVEDGKLIRTWGIQRDITERKRTQEALRESQAELAHMARIATMGELTASIAHEINQPLTAAITNGSACLRWLAMQPPNLDEARDALTAAIGEANRASEVIRRIRALLAKAPPQMRTLDVNEILREVLALVSTELDRGCVCVQTNLAGDLSAVPGDRVQLQQVVLNLILNAIEAMSTITDRRRELLVRSTNDSDGVLVQVQDSGRGLIPKQEDRIFEPFFTTKPQGIGMGLAIARSIVEAHGGRLWATDGSPHGAVFQFSLPKEGVP